MAEAQAADGRYVFLDYLRAAAAWMVVWDHLANIMPGWAGWVFVPARWIRTHINEPLGIIQDFGWLGVALFFLISGFIITDRARVETAAEFAVKRLLRIYPMLIVTVLICAAFVIEKDKVTVASVLSNMTLANYAMVPQVVLVGVAWSLVVEVMFYALTAATQALRDNPHRMAVNLVVIALALWRREAFGQSSLQLASYAGFLPLLVMGQAVYWWLSRSRLSAPWGLGYLAAAFSLFVLGVQTMNPAYMAVTNSYLISVVYAFLVFLVMLRARLPELRAVRFLSDTSYSMYLMHGTVGFLVLKALEGRVPLAAAIAAAMAISLAVSFATFRLVETPANRLARRLSRRWRKSPAAAPA